MAYDRLRSSDLQEVLPVEGALFGLKEDVHQSTRRPHSQPSRSGFQRPLSPQPSTSTPFAIVDPLSNIDDIRELFDLSSTSGEENDPFSEDDDQSTVLHLDVDVNPDASYLLDDSLKPSLSPDSLEPIIPPIFTTAQQPTSRSHSPQLFTSTASAFEDPQSDNDDDDIGELDLSSSSGEENKPSSKDEDEAVQLIRACLGVRGLDAARDAKAHEKGLLVLSRYKVHMSPQEIVHCPKCGNLMVMIQDSGRGIGWQFYCPRPCRTTISPLASTFLARMRLREVGADTFVKVALMWVQNFNQTQTQAQEVLMKYEVFL